MLDTIYSEIESLLKLSQVDPVAKLEAEIIYRTMRGTEDISVSLLERFIETARSLHGEIAYSQALLASSSACRIAGKDEDAIRFIDLAFDHAIAHKLRARIPVIKMGTVRLHVAAGNWAAARAALSTDSMYPIPADEINTRAEWEFFDARVSLEEGNLKRAEAAISGFGNVPHSFSANRRAACLAIISRLRLARGDLDESFRSLLGDLEATHTFNWDLGNQDFEAHALFLGWTALGEETRASCLLRDYTGTYRTSRRLLSRELRELVNSRERRLEKRPEPVAKVQSFRELGEAHPY